MLRVGVVRIDRWWTLVFDDHCGSAVSADGVDFDLGHAAAATGSLWVLSLLAASRGAIVGLHRIGGMR
jgi:hypothetical protein